jgi:hypothetical protein
MSTSINDEIDANPYPTEWGTAAEFADIVCTSSHICYFLDALCKLQHDTMLSMQLLHTCCTRSKA